MLVNALQGKFTKKAKEQKTQFESELRRVVEKTVDALNLKIEDYEKNLY